MSTLEILANGEIEVALRAHHDAWPQSRLAIAELLATTVAAILDGEHWAFQPDGDDLRLIIPSLSEQDEEEISKHIPPLERRSGFGAWPIAAADLVDVDHWFMGTQWDYSKPTPALAFAKRLVSPALQRLTGCWRIRTGSAPSTLRARLALVDATVEAHEILGLDPAPMLQMLDPEMDADGFFELRKELRTSWSRRPENFTDRVSLLLTRDLARQAAKKQLPDGTVAESAVTKGRISEPGRILLGDWRAISSYLGLEKARDKATEPAKPLPLEEPGPISERLAVMRSWWSYADDLWASQSFGDPPLFALDPYRPPNVDPTTGELGTYPPLPATFPNQAAIDKCWGLRSARENPLRLIKQPNPTAAMVEAIGMPFRFWDGVALTVYFLNHGPTARCTLEDIHIYYERDEAQMAKAGVPIDPGLWDELRTAHELAERACKDWWIEGREARELVDELQADGADPKLIKSFRRKGRTVQKEWAPRLLLRSKAFNAMRDVLTSSRRAWTENHLDSWLTAQWRDDLTAAGVAHLEAVRDRDGKPLSEKAAWRMLGPTANRWFGGNCAELAAVIGVEGPIAAAPEVFS